MSDLVSIITPLYNCEPFFKDTICCVLNQTYENLEWIIVDDRSRDGSLALARSAAAGDARIQVHGMECNQGPAVARNFAISQARGRFIAFLDSDDLWKPEKLERQTAFMLENDISFSYSYYEIMDEAGIPLNRTARPPMKLTYRDMLKKNHIGCLTAMYDAEAIGKVYMPLIRKRQDYGLWLKILKKTEFAHCLPESLALYRLRSSSVSGNKLGLLKYNWKLFRNVEELSFFRSLYCLLWNIGYKVSDSINRE